MNAFNLATPQPPMNVNFQQGGRGLIQGPLVAKFFMDIRQRLYRDYIIIMDMSLSMLGPRWRQAKYAVMRIAPYACQADPDGITLYLFSRKYLLWINFVN